jgi:hypothetical protein
MTSHHSFFLPFFCGTDGEWAELQDRLVINLRQHSREFSNIDESRNKATKFSGVSGCGRGRFSEF